MTYIVAIETLQPLILLCSILSILCLDLLNLFLGIRSNIRGNGFSRIHGVPLVLYAYVCIVTREKPVFFGGEPLLIFKILDFAILSVFHVLLTYAIPMAHRK